MLRDVAVPPYDLPLDTAMQTLATSVLWGASLLFLAWTLKIWRDEGSPFAFILWCSVAVGSLIEPLYDTAYHLFWLDNGDQWTLFTAFGLPQPVWVMPAYIMVFAFPAVILSRKIEKGAGLDTIWKFAALTACTTTIFETIAVNIDLYVYYGDHPMRVFDYPIWIGFMEAAQITGFAILATVLKMRAVKVQHLLALFVIFPANFAFDTLGAGFPTIMAINTPDPQDWVMWVTAPISIGLAATALWWTSQLLVWQQRAMGVKEASWESSGPTAAEPAPALPREPELV